MKSFSQIQAYSFYNHTALRGPLNSKRMDSNVSGSAGLVTLLSFSLESVSGDRSSWNIGCIHSQ